MKVGAYKAFVAMFYALDSAYDGDSARLREYLCDANPFLFRDEGSADPSVFEAFKSDYSDRADEVSSFNYA